MDQRIAVGQVIKPFGVRGEVKVYLLTPDAKRFKKVKRIFLEDGTPLSIGSLQIREGFVYIRFREITNLDQAKQIVGSFLEVEPDERIRPPKGSYFISDLIGMKVRSTEGKELGNLVEVLENRGNDVYVVKGRSREWLIPALKSIIREVNVEQKVMTIAPMEGLLD